MKRLLVILTPFLIFALILGAIGCGEKETPTPAATTTPTATPTATAKPTTATPVGTATATPGPSPTATLPPTSAPPTGTATATPTGTATTAPTPTPTTGGKPEGEIKIALANLFGQSFDPLTTGVLFSKTYLDSMYDTLAGVSPDGELSTETGIANKWEHSADYTIWTFYLREGVKFHNGDDLTAEDVKYSIEQLGIPKATGNSAKLIFNNIKEITVDGPYQVTVNLKASYLFLDFLLSAGSGMEGMIRPKKYIEANGLDFFATHPVGSGPYRFVENVANSHIKLEALDNHFALGVPKYKTITIFQVPEEITRTAMLKGGQADAIDISRESLAGVQRDGFNIHTSRLDSVVYLQFEVHTGGSNPLSDPKVREALWLAINKQLILDTLFGGLGELEGQSYYYPFVLGSVDLPPKPYDPERAKQLLQEAGYPERFSVPTINILSFVRAGFPEGPSLLEAIAFDWMKIGVKVKITPSDLATWAGSLMTKATVNGVTFQALPMSKLFTTTLAGQRSVPPGTFAFFTNPPDLGYDALLDEQAAAKTQDEWLEATEKLATYVYENSRQPALFRLKRYYGSNQKVTQWDLGLNNIDFLNLRSLAKR